MKKTYFIGLGGSGLKTVSQIQKKVHQLPNADDYLFTYDIGRKGRLYRARICFDNIKKPEWEYITKDPSIARQGGNFIYEDGTYYRVAQDCSKNYGESISILKILQNDTEGYKEDLVKKVSYKDINVKVGRGLIGVHTYNRSNKYEVIDLRYYGFNLRDYIGFLKNSFRK